MINQNPILVNRKMYFVIFIENEIKIRHFILLKISFLF